MDVRDQILEAATHQMAARGYNGTTVQAVADAVGIRKPSVLYHFSNKENLRKAVLERILSRWNEVLPRLMMASARAGVERFDGVIAEIMAFFAKDPDRARLLLREMLDRPRAMEEYLLAFVRPWLDLVAGYIERGKNIGEIHPSVDALAYVLQLSIFCLTAIATSEAFSILLAESSEERAEGQRRFLAELVRMGRSSLFLPSALPPI